MAQRKKASANVTPLAEQVRPVRPVLNRLADSDDPTARWVGTTARRELASPAAAKRLANG